MLELTEEEALKLDFEARRKNDSILHYICFGIILGCHYFIINGGYLLYFIPLLFSLFSIGADFYSNWRIYYYYEKYNDSNKDIIVPDFGYCWYLIPAVCAILSYLILLLNTSFNLI